MEPVRIPLFGQMNRRGFSTGANNVGLGYDQRFIRVCPTVIANAITKTSTVYAQKWPGWVTSASGNTATYDFLHVPSFENAAFSNPSNFYKAGATVYYGTTTAGTLEGVTPRLMGLTQTIINDVLYYLFTITATGVETGWFLPTNAPGISATFTGDTTNGSAVVTNVSSTSGLYVGQKITGTGITSSPTTRIQSIDSSSQITMTANATATNATVTITREHMAKIIDSQFPSDIRGGFVVLDGTTYIIDSAGDIYGSDLNSVTSWTSTNVITADAKPDQGSFLFRQRNQIVAFGRESIQWFYNAGNPTGSLLSASPQLFIGTGAYGGAVRGRSCTYGDFVFWLGGGRTTPSVWMLNGFEPKRISTPPVDAVLSYLTPFMQAFSFNGYTWLYLIDSAFLNTYQLLYCVELDMWMETNFPSGLIISQDDDDIWAVSASNSDGDLYKIDVGNTSGVMSYQDDGAAYTMTIQLGRHDFGTGNRKFAKSIELIADTQASGTTTLEVSKDDFATWETIGTFDMTKAKKIIYRCGSFVGGAAFRLTHSANTAWRGEALVFDLGIGTH